LTFSLFCDILNGKFGLSQQQKTRCSVKNTVANTSVAVGGFGYLYLIVALIRSSGEGLSLTTFALLSALAWITSLTMLKQKANPAVPMIFGLGATITTITLLIKGRYGWSNFDTLIAALVVACIVLWLTSGPKLALIMSIVASAIAFIPFIALTWKSPGTSPIIPNTCFLLANILAFASAKTWTLEDRLYSSVNIVLCSALVIPWLLG
jgi:hypothetical protein